MRTCAPCWGCAMSAALNPEDDPQDYLSADDLPDPYATLDADMAGDPGLDVSEVENVLGGAAESDLERAAREHEEALAPYLEKRLRQLSEYVTEVAAEWAMLGESADDSEAGSKMLAEANNRRELDKFMVRDDAEQDYRRAKLETVALEALRHHEAGEDDKR